MSGDTHLVSMHLDVPNKTIVIIVSATLIAWVLVVACTSSDGRDSTTPGDASDVNATEVSEPEQAIVEGVFLRIIEPLDEARGYCIDIPGHLAGVRLDSPLQVHTCKHGIWNQDGRFDADALENGVLRMPEYELCLQAENSSNGARLLLRSCAQEELQRWELQDAGQIVLAAFPQRCITVADGPGRDAGGPQYLMKGVGLDSCTQQASDRQRWTTTIPR